MTLIKFCGHILFDGHRKASPSKLQAIENWKPEMVKTVTHLKGFLGLAQFYSTYVKDFARIALPLTEQLKGKLPQNKQVIWTDEMRVSFECPEESSTGKCCTGYCRSFQAICTGS